MTNTSTAPTEGARVIKRTKKPGEEAAPWEGKDELAAFRGENEIAEQAVKDAASPKADPQFTRDDIAAAIKAVRKFAHARGWALAGLDSYQVPVDRPYIDEGGTSTNILHLDIDRREVSAGKMVVPLTDQEKSDLQPHFRVLRTLDYDRAYIASDAGRPPSIGEAWHFVTSWPLFSAAGDKVGTCIRYETKPGKKGGSVSKKYVGWFRLNGAWTTVPEFPFDVRPFGEFAPGHEEKPVLLTEGPKAMDAAIALSKQDTRLGLALRQYDIRSWHGADDGVKHTDWSSFKDRNVYCMCDDDEAGLENMLAVARAVTEAGGCPAILRLGKFNGGKGEDFADTGYAKRFEDWLAEALPLFRASTFPTYLDKEGKPRLRRPFLRNWVWVPSAKLIVSNSTLENYDYETFNKMFPRALNMLTSHDKRIQASELTYLPGSPYGIQEGGSFNLAVMSPLRNLKPAETSELPGEIDTILREMIRDKDEREALLDFEAHHVAYPNAVPGRASLYVGAHGVGKTSLAKFFGSLVGRQVETDVESILGAFQTPDLMFAASAFVEEMFDYTRGEGHSIYNRSKAFITAETRQMNIKNRPQFVIKNNLRLRATSNQPDALMLEEGDRRWLIVTVQKAPSWKPGIFEKHRIAIYRALLCRGLANKEQLKAPPVTKSKRDMADAGLPPGLRKVKACIESIPEGACVPVNDFVSEFGIHAGIPKKYFRRWGLHPLGQVSFHPIVRPGGRKESKMASHRWRPKFSMWIKVAPDHRGPIQELAPPDIEARLYPIGDRRSQALDAIRQSMAARKEAAERAAKAEEASGLASAPPVA